MKRRLLNVGTDVNQLRTVDNKLPKESYSGSLVSDLIHLEGAEAYAVYDSKFYAGMPAVTRNQFGKGQAWYVGTDGEEDLLNDVIDQILEVAGIDGYGIQPEGVEITKRVKGEQSFIFVLNHYDTPATAKTSFEGYTDLLTGQVVAADIELAPFDVKILVK